MPRCRRRRVANHIAAQVRHAENKVAEMDRHAMALAASLTELDELRASLVSQYMHAALVSIELRAKLHSLKKEM